MNTFAEAVFEPEAGTLVLISAQNHLAALSGLNVSNALFFFFYFRKVFLATDAVFFTLFPIPSCGAELRFLRADPEKTVTQMCLPEHGFKSGPNCSFSTAVKGGARRRRALLM